MRLFIAAFFDKEVVDNLSASYVVLKENSISLRNNAKQNLHLTFAFLGECEEDKIDKIKEIVDKTFSKQSIATIGGFNYFNSKNGKTVYRSLTLEKEFNDQVINLRNILEKEGLCTIDNPTYTPHITIARDVHIKEGIDIKELSCKPITSKIKAISLVQSIFNPRGPNTYKLIYSKNLI